MSEKIKIAVDAMGGDGSPKKVIDGIIYNHQSNKNNFYKIFGDKNKISPLIENKINKEFYEIFHTENAIKSTDSPLEGAKRGKDTSMWLAIDNSDRKKFPLLRLNGQKIKIKRKNSLRFPNSSVVAGQAN